MNKKYLIPLSILLVISIVVIILINNKDIKPFYLENNYYGASNIIDIKTDELNKLIKNKESFAVLIYQPVCVTSSNFESIVKEFVDENKISIKKIAFSNIKDTEVGDLVKYYPSFLIYKNGKLVDYLDASCDEDTNCFKSKDGFKNWVTKYVKLKNENSNDTFDKKDDIDENMILERLVLDNVVKEKNKVNIYFFWGNGCPHCKEEFEFFDSIKDKYGKYYNLYTFETWYNLENVKVLYTFANSMGDKVTGIPYTIIGKTSITGFNESKKSEVLEAIENNKDGFDVYFDKINK